MIFRNLTPSGDFTFGSGRQNYLRDDGAVALNIQTRLKSFLGDCFWDLTAGIDWWNLLGQRNPQAQVNILIGVRSVLASSYGVVRINSVNALTNGSTRNLALTYNVDTIFSRNVVGTVQP